jgi:hypothetical protein
VTWTGKGQSWPDADDPEPGDHEPLGTFSENPGESLAHRRGDGIPPISPYIQEEDDPED